MEAGNLRVGAHQRARSVGSRRPVAPEPERGVSPVPDAARHVATRGMTSEQEGQYRDRIAAYMHKAMREAKLFTSWVNPSPPHESAMARFVEFVLAPENTAFRNEFLPFQRRIAQYGLYNSLAQVTLKVGAPGVPDFYQGTELWDFSLVDPDNRRPVDYEQRRALLQHSSGTAPRPWRRASPAAHVTIARSCSSRACFFGSGETIWPSSSTESYDRLDVEGSRRVHLVAFARTYGRQRVIVVPRLIATLLPDSNLQPLGERVWGDTRIELPQDGPTVYRDVLAQHCVRACNEDRAGSPSDDRSRRPRPGQKTLRAADVFQHFPVAFLEGR